MSHTAATWGGAQESIMFETEGSPVSILDSIWWFLFGA